MKQFCLNAISTLENVNPKDFGKMFVELRMEFARKHSGGLIFSTFHGVEFFENIINCLNGMTWEEEKGEFGNNFRKLIERNI